VGSWRKENADDLEESIFVNNPFLEDLLEWRDSPEGQQFSELADTLCHDHRNLRQPQFWTPTRRSATSMTASAA
jgi:hypothetical protein